ncbi:MAG: nickel pincer cofactor biosynthesis protein LarB [Planctomycetota bacterium]
MDRDTLRSMLDEVAAGRLGPEDALERLRRLPFEDTGFARIDHHRELRAGAPEVIYCPGKTTEQVLEIAERMIDAGSDVLATRANDAIFEAMRRRWEQTAVHEAARIAAVLQPDRPPPVGNVMICCAGTADIPVAEEARITAETLGNQVRRAYDVGVAGLHRLLANTEDIQQANVVVVVAGMEGALASVVGGLAGCPVIAVPTSVGYGASFGGVAPLLTMLNSCAPAVSVVNIDNGFGAGYIASLINHLAAG